MRLGCGQVGCGQVGAVALDALEDSDVLAIVASVEAALGSAITTTQKDGIRTFITGEKAAGRWASLKYLSLPVWANASANAIDWISRDAGTWTGTLTHAAGYVQSDSTSGYLTTGKNFVGLGVLTTSLTLGVLIKQADAGNFSPLINGVGTGLTDWAPSLGVIFDITNATGGRLSVPAMNKITGILTGRVVGTTQTLRTRKTAGIESENSRTVGSLDSYTTDEITCLGASGGEKSGHQVGAFFVGMGLSDADDAALTLNLKTLWETLTGLTLP